MAAPIYLRRRANDATLLRQLASLDAANHALAEITSRIVREGASEVDEDRIRAVCNEVDHQNHVFRTLIAESCGFGAEEDVDDADEFRGSLIASYRAVIEGHQPVEGYVEADVLTPGLMAAE